MALLRVLEVCRFRRSAFTLLVVAMLTAWLAEGQVQTPDTHPGSTVSGTVVNSVTREPVGRALVYTIDERYAAFTDDHGHFELNVAEQAPAPGGAGMSTAQTILQGREARLPDDRRDSGPAPRLVPDKAT